MTHRIPRPDLPELFWSRTVGATEACRLCAGIDLVQLEGFAIMKEYVEVPSADLMDRFDACPRCDQNPVDAPPTRQKRSDE